MNTSYIRLNFYIYFNEIKLKRKKSTEGRHIFLSNETESLTLYIVIEV